MNGGGAEEVEAATMLAGEFTDFFQQGLIGSMSDCIYINSRKIRQD